MKFFFDNNLAIKLAHGLDQMVSPNHRVVHLRDEFLPNVEDTVWMRALAKEEDLVIVTADVAISRNPRVAYFGVNNTACVKPPLLVASHRI